MSARRALFLCAVAGLLVPAISLVAMQVTNENLNASVLVERVVLVVWPAAIMLMASQAATPLDLALDPVLMISVLANMVFYGVIGMLLWAGFKHKRVFLVPALLLVTLVLFMMCRV